MHNKPHTPEAKLKMSLAKKGKHFSPATEFKKGNKPWTAGKKLPYIPHLKMRGHIPWNKGLKTAAPRLCRVCGISLGHGKNIYCAKHSPYKRGKFHSHWRGDMVKYGSLHDWIESKLGKTRTCDLCRTTTAKIYDWANKNHTYKRNFDDWLRLCRKCHIKYDKEFNNSVFGRRVI